jgi:hypothetical protein
LPGAAINPGTGPHAIGRSALVAESYQMPLKDGPTIKIAVVNYLVYASTYGSQIFGSFRKYAEHNGLVRAKVIEFAMTICAAAKSCRLDYEVVTFRQFS